MWMMAAAMVGTALSTALSAKSAADQGIVQQNALNARATASLREAMETDVRADETALQAQQEEEIRMEKLKGIIGANAVAAVSSGLTSDSASVEAIAQQTRDVTGRDIANVKYMGSSREAALHRQAGYLREGADTYRRAGEEARSAANLAMWGTILKGATSMALYGSLGGMGGGSGTVSPPPAGAAGNPTAGV